MILEQILRQLRNGLDDELGSDSQRLWKDWELVVYINRAIREICKELACLTADDDFTETLATGTITLTGAAGQIASVSVNGVVITSAAIPFNTDLNTTAADLAANINAYAVNPANTNSILFTAQAAGAVVTITAPANTGSTPNNYAITASMSGGMSFTSTTMSGGSCLCKLFLIPGQAKYLINSKLIVVTRFKTTKWFNPLKPSTKAELDANKPGWEDDTNGTPYTWIPDYKGRKVTMVPPPDAADTVTLDVVRFPYADLDMSNLKAEPEIAEEYQDPIVPWGKREAFLKPDRETLNMNKSVKNEQEFYRMIEQIKAKIDIPRQGRGSGFGHTGAY